MPIESLSHSAMSYLSVYCHFVFRTKQSKEVFNATNSLKLFQYICGICKKKDCRVLAINGISDHIHIALCLGSGVAIAQLMQEVKRGSSYWIAENHNDFPRFEGWGKGYFCSTFSARDIDKVKRYIDNQQLHHKEKSFGEEMKDFFEATGMGDKLEYFLND